MHYPTHLRPVYDDCARPWYEVVRYGLVIGYVSDRHNRYWFTGYDGRSFTADFLSEMERNLWRAYDGREY